MFKIAFRSIFRNSRRSATTFLSIAVGTAAMLIFAAYALYDVYVLQTTTVQRGGHLTVFAKGYFEFGSGEPALWGMTDYASVVKLIAEDTVLKPAHGLFSRPASCLPIRRACIAGMNISLARAWRIPRSIAMILRAA
jgi:hypothetical protein